MQQVAALIVPTEAKRTQRSNEIIRFEFIGVLSERNF